MNDRRSRCLLLVGCSILCLVLGCSGSRPRQQFDRLLGRENLEKKAALGIETPSQRIVELRELAQEAPERPQAEQEQVALQIAHSIKSELDPLVRSEMIRALASFQTASAQSVLIAGLQDPETQVRVACCESLGQRQGTEVITALGETLANDTDIDVRLAAARSLGETGDSAAIKSLGVALEDTNPALQYRAVESLQALTGGNYGYDVNAWREYVSGTAAEPPAPPTLAERLRNLF